MSQKPEHLIYGSLNIPEEAKYKLNTGMYNENYIYDNDYNYHGQQTGGNQIRICCLNNK
jgi:hypothetical protein